HASNSSTGNSPTVAAKVLKRWWPGISSKTKKPDRAWVFRQGRYGPLSLTGTPRGRADARSGGSLATLSAGQVDRRAARSDLGTTPAYESVPDASGGTARSGPFAQHAQSGGHPLDAGLGPCASLLPEL